MTVCPICKRASGARGDNKAWPFCCERCQLIDLGKWFAEDYRVPAEPADGVDEAPLRSDARLDPDD